MTKPTIAALALLLAPLLALATAPLPAAAQCRLLWGAHLRGDVVLTRVVVVRLGPI